MPLSMFINTFPLFHFFVSAIFQISSFFVRAAFLRLGTSASSNLHFWIKVSFSSFMTCFVFACFYLVGR
ncbi:uncharacterized protein DS421_4g131750 [Arachis hypogaea]|nr:uncharacterized protein DS421_4g131750 [Arachis hypogaea]